MRNRPLEVSCGSIYISSHKAGGLENESPQGFFREAAGGLADRMALMLCPLAPIIRFEYPVERSTFPERVVNLHVAILVDE